MSSNDRRRDTRVKVRAPLRIRTLDRSASKEELTEAENISQRGIYFTTSFPLKVGMVVEVSLYMLQETAEKMSSDVKCVARVVHVHADSRLGDKVGVGLHIERYEARLPAGERWTS